MIPIMRLALTTALYMAAIVAPRPAPGQQLSPETEAKVAAVVQKALADSSVPSASVGIVQNGKVVYTHAFGLAHVTPPLQAEAEMAYPIGSISKQFTATAVLLLQQQGKLSLNDTVSKYFPELTRASEVRIVNLLTHTSGYQDYAPQDYTIPAWKLPGDPLKVVHEFAGKPLDFDPGTQWQYSNTNFVLAALIVQKVSREPFAAFLQEHVLEPAGLNNVLNLNVDQARLQVTGYMRNALAAIRPAALEAPGWYLGDGDLAMAAGQLLKWDLTIMDQTLLTPDSYKQMETPFLLKDGKATTYGLGVEVLALNGRHIVEHSGEVGGFVAENIIWPDDHVAIAVLTNQEASSAATDIAREIAPLVLPPNAHASVAEAFLPKLKIIIAGLQEGEIDRSLFTANCNDYFDPTALSDYQSSLAPLGTITTITSGRPTLRGGMTYGSYRVAFSGGTTIIVTTFLEPDGKIEQLLVEGKA